MHEIAQRPSERRTNQEKNKGLLEILQISLSFHIPEAWKRYPFRRNASLPLLYYREYPPEAAQ